MPQGCMTPRCVKFNLTQRTRIKRIQRLIQQAEDMGWPALAESLKQDLKRCIENPTERFATVKQRR